MDLPADGDGADDYGQVVPIKYLSDPELDQFAVVSDLLQSLAQAHVLAHIDQGPYQTIVVNGLAAPGGVQGAVAEAWTVEAKTIESSTEDGYVRVRVWTDAASAEQRIRAEFRFFAPPRLREDGTPADYGTWHLDLGYGANHASSLALDVTSSEDGTSIAKLHRVAGSEVRAIFQRTQNAGRGHSIATTGSGREVAYAYDQARLAIQAGSEPVTVKLRTSPVDVAYRYGLYDAASKQDVLRTKNFGFPLQIVGAGSSSYGFYSAWRGRTFALDNALAAIPAGTHVQQIALTGAAGATYEVAPTRSGVLSRSTYVESSLDELRDFVAQLWVDSLQTVWFDGSGFQVCSDFTSWQSPHTCTPGWQPLNDLSALAGTPAITVFASVVVREDQKFHTYKYRTGTAAGFYELHPDGTVSAQRYVPAAGDYFAVQSLGFRYVTLTTTGWREKTVATSSGGKVEFVEGADRALSLERGKTYVLSAHGNQYSVTQLDASYQVKMRVDTVLTPANAARLAPASAVFSPAPATGNDGSTYRFISDPADGKFLQLVYVDVGPSDAAFVQPGAVVTKSLLAMTVRDGDVSLGTFDWDRSPYTGISTPLLDASNAALAIEEPIPFEAIELASHAGHKQVRHLSFDGMFGQLAGLADVRTALFENGNLMTRELADSYVGVPAGTTLVDARNGHRYLTRPLVLVQYLPASGSDPGNLDVAAARQLDLATVPNFVDRGMGDAPRVAR